MGEVAGLFASLGLRLDTGAWAKGDAAIQGAKRSVDALDGVFQDKAGRWRAASGRYLSMGEKAQLAAQGVKGLGDEADKAGKRARNSAGAIGDSFLEAGNRVKAAGALMTGALTFFGQRAVKEGVEFNATMEDNKAKIAGLMSLAKHTEFSDELKTADSLVESLSVRAASLPGTTAEYIDMLSQIAGPVTDAKLSMKDLEDITVGASVAAKTLGIAVDQGARDITGALRGQFNSRDQLTRPLLEARGFKGDEGRARFNALTDAQRAAELLAGTKAPQLTAMAAAQGASFHGVMSTLEDAWQHFQGAVGKPLFDTLGNAIKDVNAWLEANKVKVAEVAATIGGVLVKAFEIVSAAMQFFMEHGDLVKAMLISIGVVLAGLAIAWVAGFWPIFAAIAGITAVVFAIRWLIDQAAGVKALAGVFSLILLPVTGVVFVVTLLIDLIYKLVKAPERIGAAFRRAFDAVVGAVKTAAGAVRDAFEAAFEAIGDLPIIKQLIWLVGKVADLTGIGRYKGGELLQDQGTMSSEEFRRAHPEIDTPASRSMNDLHSRLVRGDSDLTLPSTETSGRNRDQSIGAVETNITVNPPAGADPKEVANETRKAFDEHWNAKMRRARDAQ